MTTESNAPLAQDPVDDWVQRSSMGALWVTFGAMAFFFVVLAVGLPMFMIADQITDSGASSGTPVVTTPVLAGSEIALENGCVACHTTDGATSVGPTWQGLAGSERPLESGETVIADDEYLHTSIVDPAAQVVEGFSPVMPADYADKLSEQDITDLIEYIHSLS